MFSINMYTVQLLGIVNVDCVKLFVMMNKTSRNVTYSCDIAAVITLLTNL